MKTQPPPKTIKIGDFYVPIDDIRTKLEKGILHLTKESAELHAKALLSFTATNINEHNRAQL